MKITPVFSCAASLAAVLLVSKSCVAQQGFLMGTYFTVPGNHPDFNRGAQDGGNVTGLVESFLGADGLPVRSNKGKTYPGPNSSS